VSQYPDVVRRALGEAGIDDPKVIDYVVGEIVSEMRSRILPINVSYGGVADQEIRITMLEELLKQIAKIVSDNSDVLFKEEKSAEGVTTILHVSLFK
jgi:hypothetical protein